MATAQGLGRERQKREFSWGNKENAGQYEKVRELKTRQPLKKEQLSQTSYGLLRTDEPFWK